MNKLIILWLLPMVFFFSCGKNGIFKDRAKDCIYDFVIPDNDSVSAKSYLIGDISGQDLHIYDGDGEFVFMIAGITGFTSYPGEWIDPSSDTLKDAKSALGFIFMQEEPENFPVYFSITTPFYKFGTSFVDMVDSIANKKNLTVGDDNDKINGYTFSFSIPCEKYNLSPIQFATGIKWLDSYYYDQNGKWIKVVNFSKKSTTTGRWEYDITFDINVNLFTRRGYYGDLKGIFKTHFSLKK